MSTKPGYEIREYRFVTDAEQKAKVAVAIDDLPVLPEVLRRLHDLGYDLREAYTVLEACYEERKRNAIDAAVRLIQQPSTETETEAQ